MGEQKYEIDSQKLEEFYDDLISLEDWIPFEIKSSLPIEIAIKIGSKVKNKDLWWDRLMKHQRANYGEDYYDYINWEIETFLRKYPYFKPIFIKK
ncbi:heat-shock protein [Methanobrevibacter sp.]|uniref:heat-shock protein n=1 Tax=Methanobrevibacter sp. TaxID=66852 RepID=UPI0026DF2077|nr:heat-shock protein [Methanobrevibacter sp.]MDO5824352.1 heat-shock protein [Methanobrevibacter sp.]